MRWPPSIHLFDQKIPGINRVRDAIAAELFDPFLEAENAHLADLSVRVGIRPFFINGKPPRIFGIILARLDWGSLAQGRWSETRG